MTTRLIDLQLQCSAEWNGPGIYGLFDPVDPGRVRYVGRSVNCLSRYAAHLIAPVNPADGRQKWIHGLKENGRLPGMRMLETFDALDYEGPIGSYRLAQLEARWIDRLVADGQADLNRSMPASVR